MEALKNFRGHIPDNILEENVKLEKFLKVFDGMLSIRQAELFKYVRSFIFPAVEDIGTIKRYLGEWGAEYTDSSSRKCLDCLYNNYFEIYSRKGTAIGLKKLLTCLLWQTTEVDVIILPYIMGKPRILFEEDRPYDWLPEGSDLAGETISMAGEKIWCPTLLDNTWQDCKSNLEVRVVMQGELKPNFKQFIKDTIVLYLPMVNKEFIVINLTTT